MSGASELRESHRVEAERMLAQAVEEEVRRSGGATDGKVLFARARASLPEMTGKASEEYASYLKALETAGHRSLSERLTAKALGPAIGAISAAFVAILLFDRSHGFSSAMGAALVVAIVGALGAFLQVLIAHLWSAQRRAGARHQPGGVEQLRLEWLTALDVRGIRPYLEQQRTVAPRSVPRPRGTDEGPRTRRAQPRLRGRDRSGEAKRRSVLEQSFRHLRSPEGVFAGRREELGQITQWVHQARASTQTRPTVVVLHGPPGGGRSTLAVRAAHELRDQFRGACVVDLRGDTQEGNHLSTRDALLHLLNRLGAPREQLLFRGSSAREGADEQQLRRLYDLYQRTLTGVPVTIVLEDATDAAQVASLVPERSDSLVLVTASEALEIPEELTAWVHHLEVGALGSASSEEVLTAAAEAAATARGDSSALGGPYDSAALERVTELCGGLPFALRLVGSAFTQERTAAVLVRELADHGQDEAPEPVQRALTLRYADQSDPARRLLRRLALAGRASLGAAAAAALLETDEQEAKRQLDALAAAGLIQQVRGSRYRLHGLVRHFALERLLDEEPAEERGAAQERLIRSYAELADAVIRMVDGKTSTRAGQFGSHGFKSLESALRWLDHESSFITAALRHADESVDQSAVLHLLGALCDYCLLRGDLYRLGELNDLTQAVDRGLLTRSVQWRTGVAARQLGELDQAHTTLSSVVDLYLEAKHSSGAARTLRELGITLHHQGQLREATGKLRQALELQTGDSLRGDRAWTLHALAAVLRDRGRVDEALDMLQRSLGLHEENESVHGQAWAHYQLGQTLLRTGDLEDAYTELHQALEDYRRTQDSRGQAWAQTQLARLQLYGGDISEAVEELHAALARHRESEDVRGEAWTLYYLGLALEEAGDRDSAVQELERARSSFSRMRDVYGLACARHHLGRVSRDQRAVRAGSLHNSGFARQLLHDARSDFQRVGVAHGEAWSCLELAVIEAGNGKYTPALTLTDEAVKLFEHGQPEDEEEGGLPRVDRRGADWARFLRCTLLPLASPGGSLVGGAVAQEELATLLREDHDTREPALTESAEAYALMLERGVDLQAGWQAWQLGMVPTRQSRDVMGVAL